MDTKKISFNKPYLSGLEFKYIQDAVASKKLSGNGIFTKQCQQFFERRYNFRKCLLTSSCTDALEMAAILAGIQAGDEVIMPSYTFVSTANAFVLRGAKIVFLDSREDHPGMDEDKIEGLITEKTKAIVPVHYAGIACDMNKIMIIAEKYNLIVIEDAAQAVDAYYTDSSGEKRALGGIGHMGTFSFHETKNIISGEGGMLVVNDERFVQRSEIVWEKGTNRSAFFRGEVNKYGWVDIGSSFLPSEITAAFLWAQLENLEDIQKRRLNIWQYYYSILKESVRSIGIKIPHMPQYATNNAHMFYLIMVDMEQRDDIIQSLKSANIQAVFHYLSLHKSLFYKDKHDGRELPNADRYSETLIRLPFYYDLEKDDIDRIVSVLLNAIK
jgi:dTDP-4-amino-4,6-dideoxygalactose transaminase